MPRSGPQRVGEHAHLDPVDLEPAEQRQYVLVGERGVLPELAVAVEVRVLVGDPGQSADLVERRRLVVVPGARPDGVSGGEQRRGRRLDMVGRGHPGQ